MSSKDNKLNDVEKLLFSNDNISNSPAEKEGIKNILEQLNKAKVNVNVNSTTSKTNAFLQSCPIEMYIKKYCLLMFYKNLY